MPLFTKKPKKESPTLPAVVTEFNPQVKPKKLDDPSDLFLFRCNSCSNVHFRHAGYVSMLMPYIKGNKEQRVAEDSPHVMVCTKCRHCFIWYDSTMYDITDHIDLDAWDKLEREVNRATGPGGDC